MHQNYFKIIYESLINDGFLLVKNLYDSEIISQASKYIGVFKRVGPIIYIVLIINYENSKNDYKKILDYYYSYLENLYSEIEIKNIVSLTACVTQKADNEIIELCSVNDFFEEQPIVKSNWIVETDTKKIIVSGNQPDKILNIHKIIESALNNTNDTNSENSTSIFNAVKSKKEKDKQLIKSDNYYCTFAILIINFLVFALMELNGGSTQINVLISFGAIEPERIFVKHEYFRLLSNMFIHIGIIHLLANSLSLYIFGTRAEKYMGKLKFIIIYILSGIGCAVSSLIFTPGISAGASGAIFGIMGSIFIYSIFNKISIDGFDLYFIILFIIISIAAGFVNSNVDNAGHIGGFITGIVISFIMNFFKRHEVSKKI